MAQLDTLAHEILAAQRLAARGREEAMARLKEALAAAEEGERAAAAAAAECEKRARAHADEQQYEQARKQEERWQLGAFPTLSLSHLRPRLPILPLASLLLRPNAATFRRFSFFLQAISCTEEQHKLLQHVSDFRRARATSMCLGVRVASLCFPSPPSCRCGESAGGLARADEQNSKLFRICRIAQAVERRAARDADARRHSWQISLFGGSKLTSAFWQNY